MQIRRGERETVLIDPKHLLFRKNVKGAQKTIIENLNVDADA
jgi:hypothetical protein